MGIEPHSVAQLSIRKLSLHTHTDTSSLQSAVLGEGGAYPHPHPLTSVAVCVHVCVESVHPVPHATAPHSSPPSSHQPLQYYETEREQSPVAITNTELKTIPYREGF